MTKALVNGQPVGEYTYDASGRRVKKTAYGVTTYSIYDQFSNLIAESDASGNITKEYIYLNGQALALIDLPLPSSAPPPTISGQVSGSCGTIFAWNPKEGILGYVFILSPFLFVIFFKFTRSSKKSFILLIGFLGSAFIISLLAFQPSRLQAQTTGEVVYYYHNDHLGTPIKLTDQNQNVVWSWQYGPFGEEPLTMEPNTISQNLRFPGQYYDAETGLHYSINRYYSPKIGRYLSQDPLVTIGYSTVSYLYSDNNPIRHWDYLGLEVVYGNHNITDSTTRQKLTELDTLNGSRDVIVTGGDRTPQQNEDVGGASGSYHLTTNGGKAADIYIPGWSSEQTAELASQVGFNGVSTYDQQHKGHTHVDTRDSEWNGRNGQTLQDEPEWRKEGESKKNEEKKEVKSCK
ncbi:MAG: RHS domain-containing protein [Proteobacteria bacterium]|nr:RHS domain-containing protein [Pseudomonadota bacterium]